MKMLKRGLIITAALVMGISLVGCGKSNDKGTESTTEAVSEVDVSQAEFMKSASAGTETFHEGIYNDLTGEWNAKRKKQYGRPIAIMINNIENAIPQSGIGQADIVYEFVVEGGITRMLAIFSDYTKLEKVGSIRSCRPYYVTTANEFDAIYMHYGQSPQGQDELDRTGIDHISGLSGEGTVAFYRSSDRDAPHNVYTNGEMIKAGLDYLGCRTKHEKDFESKFLFNEEDTEPTGEAVNKLTLNMSNYTQPWFEYDSKNKVYNRFQYGDKQVDDLTGKQLTFKNIIIQFAHYTSIDDHDRQLIDLVGTGDGYYISDGKLVPITWEKADWDSVTKYKTSDGKELMLNPGKTYVTVFESNNVAGVVWE